MDRPLIEVLPRGVDWIVKVGEELRGAFAETSLAVSFACELADQLEQAGRTPRILVRFVTPH